MKINKLIYFLPLLVGMMVMLISCEEDNPKADGGEIPADNIEATDDGTEQREATDEAIDIAVDAFGLSNQRTSGVKADDCNYTATFSEENKSVVIQFSGDNCLKNRKREGTIKGTVISSTPLYQQGGALEIVYYNFKVTRKSDNKSLLINGRMVVYNSSGISNPLVRTVHGSIKIKFDNGDERTWKVARKRSVFFEDQTITWKVEGDSIGNIAEAGIDRHGNAFVTTIPTAVMVRNCSVNDLKIIAGEVVYTVGGASLSADFGYSSLKEKPANCDAKGAVLTYTDASTVAKKYFPY